MDTARSRPGADRSQRSAPGRGYARPIRRALGLGLNVLVVADPSTGEDEPVRSLLDADGPPLVTVRAAEVESVGALLDLVCRACGVDAAQQAATAVGHPASGAPDVSPDWPPDRPPVGPFDELDQLAVLTKALSARPVLDRSRRIGIVLDRPTPAVAAAMFGCLRDDLWQVPLSWVVIAEPPAADRLCRAPADAFFARILDARAYDRQDSTLVWSTTVPAR